MTLRLYFDEDGGHGDWVSAARDAGYDVLTAEEARMRGASDVEQLAFAAERERTICTHNVKHFAAIHRTTIVGGGHHAGIIAIHQWLNLSPGAFAARVAMIEALDIPVEDQLFFLSNFVPADDSGSGN